MKKRFIYCLIILAFLSAAGMNIVTGADKKSEPKKKTVSQPDKKASLDNVYENYKPDFMAKNRRGRYRIPMPGKKKMELSAEPTFFSESFVERSSRADALVAAGIEKEKKGDYRLAIDIYQQVIDKFPDTLFRISPYGVYVPVSHYCQMRILNFPPEHLKFYREKNDSRAKELFSVSKAKNSLEGLAHIRDNMLCTTFGAKSLLVLGNAELDRGHYLAALEYFNMVKTYFPEKSVHTPELTIKIKYCRKMLGEKVDIAFPSDLSNSRLGLKKLKSFIQFVKNRQPKKPDLVYQRRSPPYTSGDDYAYMIPTTDPLGLKVPVWSKPKGGGGLTVDTLPVITERSVIYRHLNRIYCRSILNGELRWINDLGGRVSWESRYKNRREDILVHDGMVFTPMYKNGPTLVALDEITGQLKWSYGPMSASTEDEATMRFRTAPTAGPSTVYAGYVQDNIGTGVHIDSEYGVIAFESRTGRIKWRKPICRLRPGKFAVDFGSGVRLRIRSFSSPPLYHQGTVYYCTNAGSIAAMDALSGRIKWLMKYPYYSHPHDIHDATRGFGRGHSSDAGRTHPAGNGLWLNQQPLIVGDDLYVLPVDSEYMLKIDRRTGKVHWTQKRPDFQAGRPSSQLVHFMGPVKSGHLLFVCSQRSYAWPTPKGKQRHPHARPGPVCLVNPDNGRPTWWSPDAVPRETEHPSIYLHSYAASVPFKVKSWGHTQTLALNGKRFQTTARPFLSSADRLYVASVAMGGMFTYGEASHLAVLDLKNRTFTNERRRFLSGEMIRQCQDAIQRAPGTLKKLKSQPKHVRKDKKMKKMIHKMSLLAKDTPPVNEHPPFLPFSRITFKKYNIPFELRVSPGRISMLYDRGKVKTAVTAKKDPESTFAASELAMAEKRYEDAAALMELCLSRISPEDVGFRSVVNQQLFRVYRQLARGSIRRRDTEDELKNVTGMSRSSTTLADEIQTLFAISDVYAHKKEYVKASKYLQGIIGKYGGYQYGVSSLYTRDKNTVGKKLADIINRCRMIVKGLEYEEFMDNNIAMMEESLPLYYSAVSPAERDLKVRSEHVAIARLIDMQQSSADFKKRFEALAATALQKKSLEDRLNRIVEFPATDTGRNVLENLLKETRSEFKKHGNDTARAAQLRKRLWRLADIARLCKFDLPESFRKQLLAPTERAAAAITFPLKETERDMEEKRGPAWLVLDRRGQKNVRPGLLFLGGRVKKKFDNKFLLYAMDTATGKTIWKATEKRGESWFDEIRLRGKGNEPGFSEAFVHNDVVVVHGLFDVLAFNLSDGTLKWRYRVPFDFEIKHTVKSGNLLVLAGESETLVLYLDTEDPAGEVAWQEKEQGDLYAKPYFYKDRLVSVRMMPFSVTTRYRSTGKLIGRRDIEDLTLRNDHPLLKNRRRIYPITHDRERLVLNGSGYYIMIDITNLRTIWKRLMDVTANSAVRMELNGDYLAIIKKDYDVESIYMLDSRTGKLLWRTDPKDSKSTQPMYSMRMRAGKLFGLRKHPGQGFYFTGIDCKTGKSLFKQITLKGYETSPAVRLRSNFYGNHLVAEVKDRQDFELKAFDTTNGKLSHTIKIKGLGDFGQHGRASCTVQNGCMAIHGKNTVKIAVKQ